MKSGEKGGGERENGGGKHGGNGKEDGVNGEGDRRGGSGEVGHGRVDRWRRVARGNEFGIGRVSVEGEY